MPSSWSQSKHIIDLPRKHYPVKILQFGSGNFIRGFADWMIQEANRKVGFDGGITVVKSASNDTALKEQEGVYTVILKGIRDAEYVKEYFTIDAVQRIVYPADNFESFLEEGTNPDLQIILSNTTESGIQFSETDSDLNNPASTFPGRLTQVLYHRFQHEINSNLIILPTELIEQNGAVLKSLVLKYASAWSLTAAFTQWINTNITFCNTLVDRIVSGFPKKSKEQVFEELGYKDELVVEAEWFHLWVIEGPRWINELLPFKKAGFNVIVTNDLSPYRARKVRILNGAHTSMAVIGTAAGLQTVKDALDHPSLGKFMRRLIYEEIVPPISGDILELEKYADEVITRLRNPAIEHKLEHIARYSFSKYKVRVLPSIIDNLERHGGIPERLAFTLAAFIYFYRGFNDGTKFKVIDNPDFMKFMSTEWEAVETSHEALELMTKRVLTSSFWDFDFSKHPQFIRKVGHLLSSITSQGLLESLQGMK